MNEVDVDGGKFSMFVGQADLSNAVAAGILYIDLLPIK